MPKISEVIEAIETRLPLGTAENWDSVGLVCGDSKQNLKSILVGVDLTKALLEEALARKANLIVIHHPPLFPKGRGLTRLVKGAPNALGTLLLEAFQKNICVYVAHTNFDRCALDGMMRLAHDLGGEPVGRVIEMPKPGEAIFTKLVTYVPKANFEKLQQALFSVGCGHLGNYDSCGFASEGKGSFRPLDKAKPAIGKLHQLEKVDEIRFETLILASLQSVAIETLKRNHPYEEVAYDLIPVEQLPVRAGLVWGLGYGFVAELEKPVSFETFAKRVKSVFQVKAFLTNECMPKQIKKIAFTPGKGSSFVPAVQAHSADVYITGEVGYHASLDAQRIGLSVIELGHRESELYFLKTFTHWFEEWGLTSSFLDERLQRIY